MFLIISECDDDDDTKDSNASLNLPYRKDSSSHSAPLDHDRLTGSNGSPILSIDTNHHVIIWNQYSRCTLSLVQLDIFHAIVADTTTS